MPVDWREGKFTKCPTLALFPSAVGLACQTALGYGFRVIPMFRLFPKTREEWFAAFLFIFQSYVVVASIVRWFFASYFTPIWPHGVLRSLVVDFDERKTIGNALCVVVLSYSGIADLIMGRRRRGCLNLCLAAMNAYAVKTTSFVVA